MVFGYTPKDYDVFCSITDDQEDEVCLLANLLEPLLPYEPLIHPTKSPKAQRYTKTALTDGSFCVYDLAVMNLDFPELDNQLDIQIIGHTTGPSVRKPLDFVERFDYNLVKAAYDPLTQEFLFHNELIVTGKH